MILISFDLWSLCIFAALLNFTLVSDFLCIVLTSATAGTLVVLATIHPRVYGKIKGCARVYGR